MAKVKPAKTKAASGAKAATGRAKTRRKRSSAAGAEGSSARSMTKQHKASSRTVVTKKKKKKKRKTAKRSPETTVSSPGPPVEPAQEHTVTEDPGQGETADAAVTAESSTGPAPSAEVVAESDPVVAPVVIDPVEAMETTPMEPTNVVDSKPSPAAADLEVFFESLIRDIDDLERSVVADPPSELPVPTDDPHAAQMPVFDEALDQFFELSKTIDDIALEPALEAQPDGVGESPASVPIPPRPPVDVEAPGRSAPATAGDAHIVGNESPVETQFDDAGSPTSSTSLVEAVDTELASEVESLLEGDFESVEQMLGGNLDEEAADISTAGVPDLSVPDPAPTPTGADPAVEPAGSDTPSQPQPEELPEEGSAPQTPVLVKESGPAAQRAAEQERQGGPAAQRAAEQERQGRREAPKAGEEELQGRREDAPPASPSVTVLPENLATALGTGDKGTLDSAVEPRTGTPAALESSSLWARVEPGVVTLFEWVNYPIRLLPQSGRPVISWLALSLLFWAPIVWLIALLVVGR